MPQGIQTGGFHNTAGFGIQRDQLDLAWQQFQEQQKQNDFAKKMSVISTVINAVDAGLGMFTNLANLANQSKALEQDQSQFDASLEFQKEKLTSDVDLANKGMGESTRQFDLMQALREKQLNQDAFMNNAQLGMQGAGLLSSMFDTNADNKRADRSLAMEERKYNESAPLRDLAIQFQRSQNEGQELNNLQQKLIWGQGSESPGLQSIQLQNQAAQAQIEGLNRENINAEMMPPGAMDLMALAASGKIPTSVLTQVFPNQRGTAEAIDKSKINSQVLAQLQEGNLGPEEWGNLPNLTPELAQRIQRSQELPGFWESLRQQGASPIASFRNMRDRQDMQERLRRELLMYYGGY